MYLSIYLPLTIVIFHLFFTGREKPSDEPSALVALQRFHEIPTKGYHLCPEYVESRSLFNPEKPGLEQVRNYSLIKLSIYSAFFTSLY